MTTNSSSVSATLRAMAQMQGEIAVEYREFPAKAATHEQFKVACEAGAQAWELISAILDRDPANWPNQLVDRCWFCNAPLPSWRSEHDPTCLWQRAKTLLEDR